MEDAARTGGIGLNSSHWSAMAGPTTGQSKLSANKTSDSNSSLLHRRTGRQMRREATTCMRAREKSRHTHTHAQMTKLVDRPRVAIGESNASLRISGNQEYIGVLIPHALHMQQLISLAANLVISRLIWCHTLSQKIMKKLDIISQARLHEKTGR